MLITSLFLLSRLSVYFYHMHFIIIIGYFSCCRPCFFPNHRLIELFLRKQYVFCKCPGKEKKRNHPSTIDCTTPSPNISTMLMWHGMFLQSPAGQVTLEGFLVISWGTKRPIRLKIQDEKQMAAWNRSKSQEYSPDPISPLGNKRLLEKNTNESNLYITTILTYH